MVDCKADLHSVGRWVLIAGAKPRWIVAQAMHCDSAEQLVKVFRGWHEIGQVVPQPVKIGHSIGQLKPPLFFSVQVTHVESHFDFGTHCCNWNHWIQCIPNKLAFNFFGSY